MKRIRMIAKNPFSICIMILTVTLFSCGQDSLRAQTNQFTGKELMQAVFFLDGDAADLIEPLREVKLDTFFGTEKIAGVRTQISSVLDQLEAKYPGTFQKFKTNITSGNHMVIEETIRTNARLLIDFLNENESVKAYTDAMKANEKPLASLIDEYFPNKHAKLSASEMKDVINSPEFKSDFSGYFNNLESRLNASGKTSQEDVCVTVGAAVVIVAAIAVLIIYAVAILNAAAVANVLAITWQEDEPEEPEDPASRKANSLMRDQITNSIAVNWAGIE